MEHLPIETRYTIISKLPVEQWSKMVEFIPCFDLPLLIRESGVKQDAVIYRAIRSADVVLVRRLMEYKLIEYCGGRVWFFSWMCKEGKTELLQLFIDDITARFGEFMMKRMWVVTGNNCLINACKQGHVEILRVFLPQLNDLNVDYRKALSTAIVCGHTEIVKLLLETPYVSPNDNNHTPIMLAYEHDKPEILEVLLSDHRFDHQCYKPGVKALLGGRPKIGKLFLQYCKNSNLHIEGLKQACRCSKDAVKLVLEYAPDHKDDSFWSIYREMLMRKVDQEDIPVLEALSDCEYFRQHVSTSRYLIEAAVHGKLRTVKFFLKHLRNADQYVRDIIKYAAFGSHSAEIPELERQLELDPTGITFVINSARKAAYGRHYGEYKEIVELLDRYMETVFPVHNTK